MKKKMICYCADCSAEAFEARIDRLAQMQYLDDGRLVFEKTDAGFSVGLEREGHEGGYWFDAVVSEENGICKAEGLIVRQRVAKPTGWKIAQTIVYVLLFIPFLLEGMIRSICRVDKKREARLDRFMTEEMGCVKNSVK